MENKFCFLKGLVDCDSGRIQDCNNKRAEECPLEKKVKNTVGKEQKFCFLKGLVDCDSGRIQDCNNKRTKVCLLETQEAADSGRTDKSSHKSSKGKEGREQNFCFLKGLVNCSAGRVQDCNIKRVTACPLD